MLALPNSFYKNPEANARQQLQHQIMCDTQRSLQQMMMELYAMRLFLSQGQLCYCIPLANQIVPPAPLYPAMPDMQYMQQFNALTPALPSSKDGLKKSGGGNEPALTKETRLRVSLRNEAKKPIICRPDECRIKPDGAEIILDLRSILPADISVNVEEKSIKIEANRVDKDGSKHYWRQYDLPSCVHAESARCLLSHDGFLHIFVPWYSMDM